MQGTLTQGKSVSSHHLPSGHVRVGTDGDLSERPLMQEERVTVLSGSHSTSKSCSLPSPRTPRISD